jgi:threonine dehydrogenase-like Zn-dependent dehydrogenase
MECLAAVVTQTGSALELRRVPIPPLEPGAVLVRVDAATLCGTDAHRWEGDLAPLERPFVPGHETCGTIVELGGALHDILGEPLRVGERIISSYAHCGHCFYCRIARQTTLCEHNTIYGAWGPERLLGGCAEYHRFPAGASFIKVPAAVSSPLAASAACALRTVLHGYEQLGAISAYETVVVLGAGPLGLYASALARDRGAGRVLTVGAPAARLAVAEAFGADAVLDLDRAPHLDDRVTWVRDRTAGRGADIVMNCASSAAFVDAMHFVRPGGRVVSLGTSGGPPLQLDLGLLFRGIRVSTVVMAEARHFYEALQFLESRADRYPFERLLSNRYPLERTTEALRRMATFEEIKPVIMPYAA